MFIMYSYENRNKAENPLALFLFSLTLTYHPGCTRSRKTFVSVMSSLLTNTLHAHTRLRIPNSSLRGYNIDEPSE